MCGIFSISSPVADNKIKEKLIKGLRRLEYRGYDSAGIAALNEDEFFIGKSVGNIDNLEAKLKNDIISAKIAISHTRWATHGVANEINAHPHRSNKVVLVHNGIVENYQELKEQLTAKGYKFISDTDTEVFAHLIDDLYSSCKNLEDLFSSLIKKVKGSYAIAFLIKDFDNKLFVAKNGSPLLVGVAENDVIFVSSDSYSISSFTDTVMYLEDEDYAILENGKITIFNDNKIVSREKKTISNLGDYDKEGFSSYMMKEIFEQPKILSELAEKYIINNKISLPNSSLDLTKLKRFHIVACGTSYYAGFVAKYWFSEILSIPVEVELASEFRYRNNHFSEDCGYIFISQSGETKDTLSSLEHTIKHTDNIICVVNVIESVMAKHAKLLLPIFASMEVGVASTKAFTCQLLTLLFFIISLSKKSEHKSLLNNLGSNLQKLVSQTLQEKDKVKQIAKELIKHDNILFLAKNSLYPISLEGALKFKELTYIHAEGMAAGELKHGPIALIEQNFPIVIITSSTDPLFVKICSTIQEVKARGAKVILIADEKAKNSLENYVDEFMLIPTSEHIFTPFSAIIIMQLLACYAAECKGLNVDKPRNLAKSVTVE